MSDDERVDPDVVSAAMTAALEQIHAEIEKIPDRVAAAIAQVVPPRPNRAARRLQMKLDGQFKKGRKH